MTKRDGRLPLLHVLVRKGPKVSAVFRPSHGVWAFLIVILGLRVRSRPPLDRGVLVVLVPASYSSYPSFQFNHSTEFLQHPTSYLPYNENASSFKFLSNVFTLTSLFSLITFNFDRPYCTVKNHVSCVRATIFDETRAFKHYTTSEIRVSKLHI